MSVLLYILGILVCLGGALTTAFGISIELSFGNSLVVAGTSAIVGGLIVVGLGAVVSQLRQLGDALGARGPLRPAHMLEPFEATGVPRAAARVPFPPKSKSVGSRPSQSGAPPAAVLTVAAPSVPPGAAEAASEEHFAVAPMLPNPEERPVETHENVSLSPFRLTRAGSDEPDRSAPPFVFGAPSEQRPEPVAESRWSIPSRRRQPEPAPPPVEEPTPPTHFDTMWPPAEPANAEPEPEARLEPRFASEAEPAHKAEAGAELQSQTQHEPPPAPPGTADSAPPPAEPEIPSSAGAGGARAVAILKSGVVDGMGYTLYVDGSIEAELPQGTLRFSSINDLRDYLEKNGQT